MSEDRGLYDAARDITHDAGFDWTDPRTGVTYIQPRVEKLAAWLYDRDEQPKPTWEVLKVQQPRDAEHYIQEAREILAFVATLRSRT